MPKSILKIPLLVEQIRISAQGKNKYRVNRYEKPIAYPSDGEMKWIKSENDFFIIPSLNIHPEALIFLFTLSSGAQKLLYYLICKEVDRKTGEYRFNALTIDHFAEFSQNIFNTVFSTVGRSRSSVGQIHRELVEKNVTINIDKGNYRMNPFITGGKTVSARKSLLVKYADILIRKGKDPRTDIYPISKSR